MPQNQPWKNKVQELYHACQEELKRTTEIGKKMLSASKTNTSLHENYEELGRLAVKQMASGQLIWVDPRVLELIDAIELSEKELEGFEGEVSNIKAAAKTEGKGPTAKD